MRIGIVADVHGNLPALDAVLAAFEREGCDRIIHTGDAVGYGSRPAEVVERLLALDRATLLMGNHDEYAVQGSAHPHMAEMSPAEREQHAWTRAQLTDEQRAAMATWSYCEQIDLNGTNLVCLHYARTPDGSDFAPILRGAEAQPSAFDARFDPPYPAIVFHGHDHAATDVRGRNRYVNPGSAGVGGWPFARYAIVSTVGDAPPEVRFGAAEYDGDRVLRDLEDRNVPGWQITVDYLRGIRV